jgi:glutathione S-transferase
MSPKHILNFSVSKKNKNGKMQERILQLDFEAGVLNNIFKESVHKHFDLKHIVGISAVAGDGTCIIVEFSDPAGKTYEYYAPSVESAQLLQHIFERIVLHNKAATSDNAPVVDLFDGLTALDTADTSNLFTAEAHSRDAGWAKGADCVYGLGSVHVYNAGAFVGGKTPLFVLSLHGVDITTPEATTIHLQAQHLFLELKFKNAAERDDILGKLKDWQGSSSFRTIFPSFFPTTTLKLVWFPPTRSKMPSWLVHEAGLDVEFIKCDVSKGEGHNPSFAQEHGILHPLYKGSVPALLDGDICLTESGAILNYLAGKYAPQFTFSESTPEFADMLRYMFFSYSELEAPLWNMAHHTFLPIPDDKKVPDSIPTDAWRLSNAFDVLRGDLKDGREFLVGNKFTLADIVVSFHIGWAAQTNQLDMTKTEDPLVAYVSRTTSREAFKETAALG